MSKETRDFLLAVLIGFVGCGFLGGYVTYSLANTSRTGNKTQLEKLETRLTELGVESQENVSEDPSSMRDIFDLMSEQNDLRAEIESLETGSHIDNFGRMTHMFANTTFGVVFVSVSASLFAGSIGFLAVTFLQYRLDHE